MSTFGPTGIWIAGTDDPASVPTTTAGQEISLRNRIVQTYADVGQRDAAYTTLSSTGKRGIMAWVTNRGGHCYFDPTSDRWEWVSVHRKVYGQVRASAANSNSTTPGVILGSTGVVTLPPGNRLIHIQVRGWCTNLSASATNIGRLIVNGGGLGVGNNETQVALPPGKDASLASSWDQVCNGTVDFSLSGLAVSDAAGVSFTNVWLQCFDIGACDD